jgi:hypothetical protein
MGLGPFPGSFRSQAGSETGPQQQVWPSSPIKSSSTSLLSLSVRECTTFFDRGVSPAPGGLGLVHGDRSGSSTTTHGLCLGLRLSLMRSPAPASIWHNLCHLCLRLRSPLVLISKSHEARATIRAKLALTLSLLMFNNQPQRPPIMWYSNLYPPKTLVAVPSLCLVPTTKLLHTNNHKTSSDISHNPATYSAFSRPSALSNWRANCSMF